MKDFDYVNSKEYNFGISVVIATLGGPILYNTIKYLNNGSLVPNEIIIIIPEKFKNNIDFKMLPPNAKIYFTNFAGQVAQRTYGFRKVNYLYTLQLDDDIILEHNCLKNMFQFILNNINIAISPTMLDLKTHKFVHYLSEPLSNDFFKLFLYKIINGQKGYICGKISISGLGMGFSTKKDYPYEVEWLPGGCVLHYSPNLIYDNYYILKGKAYAEDLFHSHMLTLNKIILYHIPNATSYVDSFSSESTSILNFFKIVFKSTKALLNLNKLTKRNSYRMLLFQFIYFFLYIPNNKIKYHFFKKNFK